MVARTPQQAEASRLLTEANLLLKNKQPFKARPLVEQAAALWPEEPHIHFYQGVCYQGMGDFPRAIAEYNEVLAADPKLSECLADIASCYQLMGNLEQAIIYFKKYLKAEPHAEDRAQIEKMIQALAEQSAKQVQASPESEDYLTAIMKDGNVERWQPDRLPIKVFISNGTDERGRPASGFREEYNEDLLAALNTWVKASGYRLAYVLVDDVKKADMVCTWTDQPGIMRGGSVEQGDTQVFSRRLPNGQHAILQVRLVILLIEPTSGQYLSEDQVKKVCLHETGHALGFAGHSTNNRDVMFYTQSPAVWAALTHRDKNTMARLYRDYPVFAWRLQGANAR